MGKRVIEVYSPEYWKKYCLKSDKAYKEFLKGDDSLMANHNSRKGGEQEINFVLELCRLGLGRAPGGKVLDVACGGGYMTDCFARMGFSATGFDMSEDAIAIAKREYPECQFFVGNGADPLSILPPHEFDVVHIREFHPFTRLDDFDFQKAVISGYLQVLKPGGMLIISHARRGGNLDFKSLDFRRLGEYLREEGGCRTFGPCFFFLFKHLRVRPRNRMVLSMLSSASNFLGWMANQRWAEFYVIMNPGGK